MRRLHIGNATLADLYQHRRLQAVLNTAARLIYRKSRCQHVTRTLLRELHWLRSRKLVFRAGHLGTLLTTSSHKHLMLFLVVFDLQTRTLSLCLADDLPRTAVGLIITLARQSRTRCQIKQLEIRTDLMS